MTTTSSPKPCGGQEAPAKSQRRECLPCDLPPFCRNHYYTGKLLTERDLHDEQRYHRDKLRLHHLALHGSGVVCGLKVKPHPYCPDRRLIVEPGLAIDGCGREIRVLEEVELELPKASEPPDEMAEPCPPYGKGSVDQDGGGKDDGGKEPVDEGSLEPRYPPPGTTPEEAYERRAEKGEEDDEGCGCDDKPWPEKPAPCNPEIDLYVCLRYSECDTEFSPAPFDECCSGQDGKKPNRICEGFLLELTTDKPEGWDEEPCKIADCKELYHELLEPCPSPVASCCLPLAILGGYEPGQKVEEDDIDNLACRPLLPSVQLLDKVIRCVLDKLPTKELTSITDLGWTHGGEYSCHDFMKMFVGDDETPKAFEVTFGSPIRTEGLSTHSFQALVVRHRDKDGEGGYLEVAPAKVWASADRLKAYLRIDRDYARHCLQGNSFDVFLKLRCDVIVDARGCPVDGNLLAKLQSDGDYVAAPPTGDGIPGGEFNSWIEILA